MDISIHSFLVYCSYGDNSWFGIYITIIIICFLFPRYHKRFFLPQESRLHIRLIQHVYHKRDACNFKTSDFLGVETHPLRPSQEGKSREGHGFF